MGFYDEDLAYVHHEGFGDYSRSAAPGLLKLLRNAGIAKGKVVDLGSGSGIWLRVLSDAGYSAVGVDQSPAMRELARRNAPKAELHMGRVRHFDLPACDAATALGEVLCYYSPDGERPELAQLFGAVHAALRPGGLFVFDLLVDGEPMAYRNFRTGEDWAILFEVSEDAESKVLTRDQTVFRRVGEKYRRSHEVHRVRVFSEAEAVRQLESAGFRVETSPTYGDFTPPPRRLVFIAAR